MPSRERSRAVERVEFPVDWPPGHVAAYLLPGAEPVLVDAGMPGAENRDRLASALATHDLAIEDIAHLVVTHPHIDHIGLVPEVIDAADPTVYAPVGVRERFARDAEDLRNAVETTVREAGLDGEEAAGVVETSVESLERNRELLATDRVDVWVDPGEPVAVAGERWTPVHTPGHQADHCCYHLPDGALLAGDMAIAPFRPVLLHAGLDRSVGDAVPAYRAALDRLGTLDVTTVHPGHGPVHDRFAATLARDRDHLAEALDRTVAALDGPTTAREVATTRATDRSFVYLLAEVVATLRQVAAEGRVEHHVADGVCYYR